MSCWLHWESALPYCRSSSFSRSPMVCCKLLLILERTTPSPRNFQCPIVDFARNRRHLKTWHVAQEALHFIVRRHVGSPHLLCHRLQSVDCTPTHARAHLPGSALRTPEQQYGAIRKVAAAGHGLWGAYASRQAHCSPPGLRTGSGASPSFRNACLENSPLLPDLSGHKAQLLLQATHAAWKIVPSTSPLVERCAECCRHRLAQGSDLACNGVVPETSRLIESRKQFPLEELIKQHRVFQP